jgi:hypothetical protein
MTEEKKPTVDGPRNAAHILREIAVLVEQHGVSMPRVQFNAYDGDRISFYIHGTTDYSISYGNTAGRKESKRADIERQYNLLTQFWDGQDGPLEWVANDPSATGHDRDYFRLTTLYRGAAIELWSSRTDVGEKVAVIESGPSITEADGAVRLIRQQATMWRPNVKLAALATPAYELEPAVQLQEIEA